VKTENRRTIAKRLAQIIAALNILLVLAWFILGFSIGAQLAFSEVTLYSVFYSVLAVLIISRNPRNTIGWLFLLMGFISALFPSFEQEALIPFVSERFLSLGIWLGELIWIPTFMIPITLVLQFFPDGRLPSKRWWPVTAASILGMVGFLTYFAFYPWEVQESIGAVYHNPFGIAGREDTFNLLESISVIALGIGMVGTLVMLVVRFRKADVIQREQMKWLVYTAVVGISMLFLSDSYNPINDFLLTAFPIVMAIVISIAILRYRLFDIDIIIRKTLVYGAITLLLALVYFGSVLLLQQAFRALTGQDSPVAIVISTLIIAIFNPLRNQVQEAIDRRFYRRKYDAQQALAEFAATARDEVELDQLTEHLLSVVQESMQPEQVSLWLETAEKK
jgi:hypothetical protein